MDIINFRSFFVHHTLKQWAHSTKCILKWKLGRCITVTISLCGFVDVFVFCVYSFHVARKCACNAGTTVYTVAWFYDYAQLCYIYMHICFVYSTRFRVVCSSMCIKIAYSNTNWAAANMIRAEWKNISCVYIYICIWPQHHITSHHITAQQSIRA